MPVANLGEGGGEIVDSEIGGDGNYFGTVAVCADLKEKKRRRFLEEQWKERRHKKGKVNKNIRFFRFIYTTTNLSVVICGYII